MGVLQHKFIRSLLSATCALSLVMGANVAFAEDEEELTPEMIAARQELKKQNDYYMRNIRPVYFPAVPFGWKIEISDDNTVSYIHAKSEGSESGTTIKMRYTRRTYGMDAAGFMDRYISANSCEDKTKVGKGFFTTSCGVSNTYAIAIGEKNNLYFIELVGNYSSASSAIISNYVNSIVSGKKVFKDRNIGDVSQNNS